jgi:hypothetical protein
MRQCVYAFVILAMIIGFAQTAPADVPEKEKQVADHFFAALKAKDFKAATADFSPKMLEFLPPDKMKANQESNIEPVIGEYVSHEFKSTEDAGEFVAYFYHSKSTKDGDVTVKLIFAKKDPTFRIEGLWFDSAKLREAHTGGSLTTAEKEKAEMVITPIVEGYFKAIKAKDFKAATKDFSAEMRKAMPPEKFKDEVEKNEAPIIGEYVSHAFQSFSVEGKFLAAVYLAKFTKEEKVQVKFVFDKNDPAYRISGLWYTSEKLKEAEKKKK